MTRRSDLKIDMYSCEGNLVQSLDDRNPARLLMEALQVKGEVLNQKDDEEYYLGVYPVGNRPDSTVS